MCWTSCRRSRSRFPAHLGAHSSCRYAQCDTVPVRLDLAVWLRYSWNEERSMRATCSRERRKVSVIAECFDKHKSLVE